MPGEKKRTVNVRRSIAPNEHASPSRKGSTGPYQDLGGAGELFQIILEPSAPDEEIASNLLATREVPLEIDFPSEAIDFEHLLAWIGDEIAGLNELPDKHRQFELKREIEEYQKALGRKLNPNRFADTQYRLASLFIELGGRSPGKDLLNSAGEAFRAALHACAREQMPRSWGNLQFGLGQVLARVGAHFRKTSSMEEAVDCYHAALLIYDQDKEPVAWATIQANLSPLLASFAKRKSDATLLKEAVTACSEALKTYSRQRQLSIRHLHIAGCLRILFQVFSELGFVSSEVDPYSGQSGRRVVGGTETPTIEEVNDDQSKEIREIIEGLNLPGRRKALAEANIEIALKATDAGISVAELAERAGVNLGKTEALADWERAIIEVAPGLTREERHKIWEQALGVTKHPIPQLTSKQLAAVEQVAKRHPWSSRPSYHHSPFDWVKEHYARWLPGLLQHHLKLDRSSLYEAFVKRVKREGGLPSWLDVPTEGEAELRNTPDPIQRARILAVRSLSKAQSRGVRSLRRAAASQPKL